MYHYKNLSTTKLIKTSLPRNSQWYEIISVIKYEYIDITPLKRDIKKYVLPLFKNHLHKFPKIQDFFFKNLKSS